MKKLEYISKGLAKRIIRKAAVEGIGWAVKACETLPTIEIGLCRDCRYFEYDHVAKVDGIPLIVAHEICNKWGDGCKTRGNGWCYLFERSDKEQKEAAGGKERL